MKNQLTLGTSSVSFKNPVFIQSCASIVGQKEGEGPLGSCFDKVCEDPLFGTDTWEAAESTMQKETALLAIRKAGLQASDIRFLFAGDLLAQTVASSFGTADLGIPFYGLFGACSTMGESLSLGSLCVAGGYGKHILCATSSHFAAQKRNFVFPWDMEIKDPYLLPGRSLVPEPVYSDTNLHPFCCQKLQLSPPSKYLCRHNRNHHRQTG